MLTTTSPTGPSSYLSPKGNSERCSKDERRLVGNGRGAEGAGTGLISRQWRVKPGVEIRSQHKPKSCWGWYRAR